MFPVHADVEELRVVAQRDLAAAVHLVGADRKCVLATGDRGAPCPGRRRRTRGVTIHGHDAGVPRCKRRNEAIDLALELAIERAGGCLSKKRLSV